MAKQATTSKQSSVAFLGTADKMDLLSLIGQVTKRKGDFFSQAESLARKVRTRERLERKMAEDSRVLVRALRNGEVRWEEYSRSLIDKTIVSALAAVLLGSQSTQPNEMMGRAWPTIIGETLQPLQNFLSETEAYLENGQLLIGDQTQDFSDEFPENEESLENYLWDQDLFTLPAGKDVVAPARPPMKKKPSWKGIESRVNRYLSSPAYSYAKLGENLVKVSQGHKLMRRIAIHDSRTCPDCRKFEELGWQAIGSLPLPGRECRCRDRCRCSVEYR